VPVTYQRADARDQPGVDGRDEDGQRAVLDGLADHNVDLIQPVFQDRDGDGRRST